MHTGILYGQPVTVYTSSELLDVLQPVVATMQSRRNNKKNPYYLDGVMTFDVETTVVKNEDKPNKKIGKYSHFNYIYHWQACVFGYLVTGRYIEEWFDFCDRLSAMLPPKNRVVCFVHNLAFEYNNAAEYFCSHAEDIKNDIFMKDNVHPLYIVNYGIEYRCTLQLTHKSLDKLSKEIGLEKGGDFDYNTPRHSKTPLTTEEEEYCLRDVHNLYKWCKFEIGRYCESIGKVPHPCYLPLTQTGYVRYDIKHQWSNTDKGHYLLRDLNMTDTQYLRCRKAFRGGDTHANFRHVCKILDNVRHRDFTSAYPAAMILFKYPMSAWKERGEISQDTLYKYLLHGYHIIAQYTLTDVSLKPRATPYISASKCDYISHGAIRENGRIMQADCISLTITEIDFKIIFNTYDFEVMSIDETMTARSGYIPPELLKVVLQYFSGKTRYKGVTEKRNEYDLSKQKLNGIYGCSATALDHTVVTIDPATFESMTVPGEIGNAYVMPYQWAPYITAYVRLLLNRFKIALGDDFIYCDTDSIFYRENTDFEKIVDKYNAEVVQLLHERAPEIGVDVDDIMPTNPKGERQYLGTFSNDDEYIIDRFETVGAKRYIYRINGIDIMTFSGVPGTKPYKDSTGKLHEGQTVEYIKNRYGKDIFKVFEDFKRKRIFIPSEQAGGKLTNYVERGNFYGTIDDGTTAERVEARSSMVLVPVDISLTMDKSLFELLFGGGILIV